MIKREFEEIVGLYEDIVSDQAKLFKDLNNSSDVIEVYKMFKFMYNFHFLTRNKKSYSKEANRYKELEANPNFPFDICGAMLPFVGVTCRHFSEYLRLLYDKLGFISSELFVYEPHVEITLTEILSEDKIKIFQDIINNAYLNANLLKSEDMRFKVYEDDIYLNISFSSNYEVNHVVNIVRNNEEEISHIFAIGDDKFYDLSNEELNYYTFRVPFIFKSYAKDVPDFLKFRFYKVSNEKNRELLSYKTDASGDIEKLKVISDYREYLEYFEEFYERNNKNYRKLKRRYDLLSLKMKNN